MIKSGNVIRAIFLCTMLLILMFNVKAYAATDDNRLKNNENVTWTFDEKTGTLVIEGTGKANISDIAVPKEKVKKLVVNKGITYISGAKNYENLIKVKLSSTVKTIGKAAFKNCRRLKIVTGLKYAKEIGPYAFYDCTNLKKVVLGDSLKKIGEYAFSGCNSIYNIVLPKSLIEIENTAFIGCVNLKSITVKSTKMTKNGIEGLECFNIYNPKLPVLKLPKKVARKYKKWINSYYDNAYEDTIEDLEDFPRSFPQKIVAY